MRFYRLISTLAAAVLLALALTTPAPVNAAFAEPGFTQTTFITGLVDPTAMQFAPDGRLFVAQKTGALRVFAADGTALGTFATVATTAGGERGLLGVAFDPSFAANGYVYVYYTTNDPPTPHNRVSRFTADPLNPNVALAGSETIILEISALNPANLNHNAGAIHFGPDGRLYIATGENQTGANAQDLTNMLGKILRINPDGSIPPDNPFVSHPDPLVRREIWAYGFRNPFTFSFQPGTGVLFVNDVGGATFEEINDVQAGQNYGWPYFENTTQLLPPPPGFTYTAPRYAFNPFIVGGCAVTGGAFYNVSVYQYPADYVGDYFFGDFCGGFINRFDTATNTAQSFATGLGFGIVDLKVSPIGELYVLMRGSNQVLRMQFDGPPQIIQHPASASVNEGQGASFTCIGTGSAALGYQWQRNGVSIPGATATTLTLGSTSAGDNGASFQCVVTNLNTAQSVTSNPAVLSVSTAQQPAISVFDPGLSKIGFLPAGSLGLPGERITWVTTVTNTGGAAGSNIVVVDNVRSEMRIESADTDRGTVSISGQRVTVTIPTLAPGESVQFRIVTTILISPVNGVMENTVTLEGSGESARATVTVARITSLPSTGETPVWRTQVIIIGTILSIGLLTLLAISLTVVLLPRKHTTYRRRIRY